MIDIRYLTVSEGTLTTEHIADNFFSMLLTLANYSSKAREFLKEYDIVDKEFKVEFLYDALNYVAGEFNCYFSTHEDDGALFMFFPIEEDF